MPVRCRSVYLPWRPCPRLGARHDMPAETLAGTRTHDYRRLLKYAAPYGRGWVAIVAATLVSTALSLVQPWPIKVLVDHVLGDVPPTGVVQAIIAMSPGADTPRGLPALVVIAGLTIFVLNSAAEVIVSWQWTRVGRRMVYSLA